MDGAFGTQGEEGKRKQGFGEETKETGHLEDLNAKGRIILKQILNKQNGFAWTGFVLVCIGTGRAVVDTMMNIRIP
jgi:hypothetical protein